MVGYCVTGGINALGKDSMLCLCLSTDYIEYCIKCIRI